MQTTKRLGLFDPDNIDPVTYYTAEERARIADQWREACAEGDQYEHRPTEA